MMGRDPIEIKVELPDNVYRNMTPQIEAAISLSVSQTLMAAKSQWETIAQQRLTSTRSDYLLGLNTDGSVVQPDAYTGILILKGKWPNMLESGFPAFDMKTGGGAGGRFMGSKHVKYKKGGGWYLTIPMRHRTPGTAGSAVGGKAMPQDIYAQARALRGKDRLTGTEGAYPPQTSWTGYQHKNGFYEGMVKNTKTYDKATQNSYFTFRRVSDKSDPKSWMHPGFSGVHAVEQVESFVRATFSQVLKKNIKTALGG